MYVYTYVQYTKACVCACVYVNVRLCVRKCHVELNLKWQVDIKIPSKHTHSNSPYLASPRPRQESSVPLLPSSCCHLSPTTRSPGTARRSGPTATNSWTERTSAPNLAGRRRRCPSRQTAWPPPLSSGVSPVRRGLVNRTQ